MANGNITKIRNADKWEGIEARYRYEVDGLVYEIERREEQYRYNRRGSFFSSVGYRHYWRAEIQTENGLVYCGRADKRGWLIAELDDSVESHKSRLEQNLF